MDRLRFQMTDILALLLRDAEEPKRKDRFRFCDYNDGCATNFFPLRRARRAMRGGKWFFSSNSAAGLQRLSRMPCVTKFGAKYGR